MRSRGTDSFTVQQLQQLLNDDVSRIEERRDKTGPATADMAEAEFELIINRERLFTKGGDAIPLEGEMYDIVVPPDNADMLSGMG